LVFGAERIDPRVEISGYGTIDGDYEKSDWTKRSYMKFNSIKYGNAPERFQPATLVEKIEGDRNWYLEDNCLGKNYLSASYARYIFEDSEGESKPSEDCLYLNVNTRNISAKTPVMVHIAGIDLEDCGTEEYPPGYLMEKDIVLVTVQYRTGPFGFLSTMTDDIPGNTGVLDIIVALKWIKNYITHFGGDPDKITIFGQHRAASIINLLTFSPLVKGQGYFHQVIYQSGTVFMKDEFTEDPLDWARGIAKNLECSSETDMTVITECLKTANAIRLIDAHNKFETTNKKFRIQFTIGGPSGVVPKSPVELLEESNYEVVPTMGGVVRQPASKLYQKLFNTNELSPVISSFTDLTKRMAKSDHQRENFEQNFPAYVFEKNFLKAFWPGLIDYASSDIKSSLCSTLSKLATKTDVYLYAFNYLGENHRIFESTSQDFVGVSLADDNLYLFQYPRYTPLNKKDKMIGKLMVELWTSFAINGTPSARGIPVWPKMEKCGPYMKIDTVSEVEFQFEDEYFSTLLDTTNYTPIIH
jgi:carboxylesterase type B